MHKLGWLATFCIVLIFSVAETAVSRAQTFTTLVTFNLANGGFPSAPLVQGRDGNLYGTTAGGGITTCDPPDGCGIVFKLTPAGTLTTLHKFCPQNNCADGSGPGALVLDVDGNFYGVADAGGANAGGTVFKITPRGTLTTLYSFCSNDANCAAGSSPRSLILATDGNFYGTTFFGGGLCSFDGCGTIFKITPSGQFTALHSFDGTDGTAPTSLIQGSDGNFYGTTYGGNQINDCESTGCGTVFKMTPSGTVTTLHIFSFTDGANPYGPLVESTKGNFSGTTYYGGTVLDVCGGGCGTIFKITSTAKFSTLHLLDWNDGAQPHSGLILATDGNYYGTTEEGFGVGTIYEVGSGGGIMNLPFDGGGNLPFAGLLQATNGTFYGSTFGGAVGDDGTLFSEDTGLGPLIAFVQPTGKAGKAAQILGQGFTGTTSVTFNGVPATSFTVFTDTYLTAVVPTKATTGPVVVTTPGGPLTSNISFRIAK